MKKIRKILKISVLCGVIMFGLLVVLMGSYYIYLYNSLEIKKELLTNGAQVSYIYNLQNEEIVPYSNGKVNFTKLNPYTIDAFLSIEDKNFYKHSGLNYKRIAKAVLKNIKAKNFIEGASTISQQLIKNTHLSQEKTLKRKINEVILTKKLEKKYSKDEILEAYLNAIYFGNSSYGLEQASHNYFNKPSHNLTISESALLAGIIKSPKKYSPLLNPENCIERRNLVLKEMLKDKKITTLQYNTAINQQINITSKNTAKEYKHYFNGAIEEACHILNLSEKDLMQGGYSIFTYQDKSEQNVLNKALNNESYYSKNSYGNTADSCGLIINNKTGGISAFGGKSYYDLINMRRSPGSAIKPILVFAPALENGIINTLTPILDEKTDFNGYSPQNVGGYYGYVSPQKAIEKSLNIPAVKILKSVGVKECIIFAKKAGLQFDEQDNNLSIALGCTSKGVSPIELAGTYLSFANAGEYIKPRFIRKICDHTGNVIYTAPTNKQRIMSTATSYLMTEMLKGSVKNGTSKILNSFNFDIAGKTGTVGIKNTNLNTDAWSVAYTSSHTFLSWLGNSTGNKEYNLEGNNNGGTFATRILKDVCESIYQNTAPCKFAQPQDIVYCDIDLNSLKEEHVVKLSTSLTPKKDIISSPFNVKYLPKISSSNYTKINNLNLWVKLLNNTPYLTFETNKLYTYKIYRVQEDKTILLETVSNFSGIKNFNDKTIKPHNFYSYYVVAAINSESNNKSTTKKEDLLSSINNFTSSKIFKTNKLDTNNCIKSNVVKIFVK